MILKKSKGLLGELTVPGDKSISHRTVMLGALAEGVTEAEGFLPGADCLSTISCFRQMGVSIHQEGDRILIHGVGLHGLKAPERILDAGNSGTTVRLLSGILAGQNFTSRITGDASIQRRPMKRIIEPLSQMGASVSSVNGNGCAPLEIHGSSLRGIHYHTPVASAQVKSCILLAGMYGQNATSVTDPALSRDHTERMLRFMGASLSSDGRTVSIQPEPRLKGKKIRIPGDISSAAYFIAAGLLVPNSEILLKNVGINTTRSGMLNVCRDMGADLTLLNEDTSGPEPVADLLVKSSSLHGTVIEGDLIPALIDELPILAVLAAFAQGTTTIRDAAELKVKESDRIASVSENLRRMGADVTPTEDGMILHGGKPLHGATIETGLDHRIAMSFSIAALAAEGDTKIPDADCVSISYPEFYQDLASLQF